MKARSFRALLLISSLMLSTGTTALPVVAADLSPDVSDSGISIDADDGGNDSTVTPDTGGGLTPDNGTDITPDGGDTSITPDDGTGTLTPDNGQQTVTPTPPQGTTVTPTPSDVPQVTWEVKYDEEAGYIHVKPSEVERGNIVYAYQIDGKWGYYYTLEDLKQAEDMNSAKKTYYTEDNSTWTWIPTIPKDVEDLYDKGGNVSTCPDEDNCFLIDLNNSMNRDNLGNHHVTFFVYYWLKDVDKGSEIYKFDFDATFTDGTVIENGSEDDLSVVIEPLELTSTKAVYSLNFATKYKLMSYTIGLADGSSSDLYDYRDDCKGMSSFSTKYTFLENGTYAVSVTDDEGNIEYQEITISNITGENDGTNDVDTIPGTDNVIAPKLTVSGVPSAKSVQIGNVVNITVNSNMSCTLSGDEIETPVKGTSVTVPITSNGVYDFYGTLDDGTYGTTSVSIDCFTEGTSSSASTSSSNSSNKTYSTIEDFWGNQLEDKLPQTGTIGLSSVIGLGIAGMASGLVLMKKKRYTSDIEDEEAEDNEK